MNRKERLPLTAASVLLAMLAFAGAGEASAQTSSAAAANQPTLAADEARHLFGNWTMTLSTPDGPLPLAFTIGERDGNVAVSFNGAGGQAITNISKTQNGFTVRSQIEYQGMNLPMVITVSPDGENLKTDWDFGDGAYAVSGTAVRADG